MATWPVWPWYLRRLRDGSDEPWCLLALATFFALLWSAEKTKPIEISLHRATVWIALYCCTVPTLPPIFRAATALLALGDTLCTIRRGDKPRLAYYALLLMATPAFASLDFIAGFPLRYLASHASAVLLNLAGIVVEPQGTLLRWGTRLVEVDAPCAGIRMLYGGIWTAASLAAYYEFRSVRTAIALCLGLATVIAANVLRTSALFFPEAGIVQLPHWTHAGVGLAVFAMAGAFLCWSASRLRSLAV
ncbi:MAG: archaeosortase/exosortase family protein [Bryobacteraceae bacterium]